MSCGIIRTLSAVEATLVSSKLRLTKKDRSWDRSQPRFGSSILGRIDSVRDEELSGTVGRKRCRRGSAIDCFVGALNVRGGFERSRVFDDDGTILGD